MTPRGPNGEPAWEDPDQAPYWITRMVHTEDLTVLTVLLEKLLKTQPKTPMRDSLESQIRDKRARVQRRN